MRWARDATMNARGRCSDGQVLTLRGPKDNGGCPLDRSRSVLAPSLHLAWGPMRRRSGGRLNAHPDSLNRLDSECLVYMY